MEKEIKKLNKKIYTPLIVMFVSFPIISILDLEENTVLSAIIFVYGLIMTAWIVTAGFLFIKLQKLKKQQKTHLNQNNSNTKL
jgi:uncharacterized membrane protein YciS (DUF1049 family)